MFIRTIEIGPSDEMAVPQLLAERRERGLPPALQQVLKIWRKLRSGSLTAKGTRDSDITKTVQAIIAGVFLNGDDELLRLTEKFDGTVLLAPKSIRVESERMEAACAALDPKFEALLDRAIGNIRRYQQRILVKAPPPLRRGGRRLGIKYTPMDRVGVYVPGGRAFYPSTVLMTVVPAQVAGVREIALASPPTSNGDVHPLVLALAKKLGVTDVYRVGGAQAIAAMALGTASVRPVQKIVGPGNAFVAEAKRQLFGKVGIDSIAGPSEVLIIADNTASPACVAADMLAQAEHDPGSAILLTTSKKLARGVAVELEKQTSTLERAAAVRAAIREYSRIIMAKSIETICDLANLFAPEHLQIITADNQAVLGKIRHAGAIFLGPHTPVPVGDYYAGPSHVLPTGGTARFFGPLSCNDFLKASSVVEYDEASLAADGPDIIDFATREGLTAHANAVRIRQKKP
ncbi:MAG: histidinol dehydrogenase [Planctomycetota bacterium]|nr:histidinol dehydrogenase [Planctomycetota bacterium]